VAEMRKWQEEAHESRAGRTRTYFDRCVAIVQPVLGRVVVTAIFVVTILTVDLKYTTEGSSWMYSVINAAMIAIGIGLAVLSTAMIIENEKRKR
jgi:hypothetical protein